MAMASGEREREKQAMLKSGNNRSATEISAERRLDSSPFSFAIQPKVVKADFSLILLY